MVQLEHLRNYQNRALGLGVYGNGGLEKTLAARTLPPPILHLDFEGGSGCLGPWTRRYKRWSDAGWTSYSPAERQELLGLVSAEKVKYAVLKPEPYVDIISFDVMEEDREKHSAPAYDKAVEVVGGFEFGEYSSLSIDPLFEFSTLTQTQAKVKAGGHSDTPMEVKFWGPAQERAAIMLRQIREYRDRGIFIYLTSSEFIDKDYGTDPRSKAQGEAVEQPYAIKGTLNVPGNLVGKVHHTLDVLCHVRMMGDRPVWVTQEEPSRSGSFNWEAKDRTGRISERYLKPSVRSVIQSVYGQAAYERIYANGRA